MAHVCVVMCTYQGERYLEAQLRSIAQQDSLPDSMVIVDDRSTDSTLAIARDFASTAGFPVRVLENVENIGFVRNFGRAIAAADGDLIVLADQDDVWKRCKLTEIRRAFSECPELGAAFSDAELVDADLRPLGTRLSEAVRYTPALQRRAREQGMFEVLLKGNVVTGATLAFRSHYRELVLPLSHSCEHDSWIALVISALAPVVFIPQPLILYRQHGTNQIGAARLGILDRVRRARRDRITGLQNRSATFRDLQRRFSSLPLSVGRRELLRQAVEHLDARSGLPQRRRERVLPVIREFASGRYGGLSHGLASACRDLIA